MKTILVSCDFSDSANHTARYAAALASECKCQLLLVHVLENQGTSILDDSASFLLPDPRLEIFYQEKLLELSKELQKNNIFLIPPEIICVPGRLSDQLNIIIRQKQVDLVVMGTQGSYHFIGKLIGTNAYHFIQKAACPVFIIPENARYKSIKTIAYASDFEIDETVYLRQLQQFAELFAAVTYIVNIKSDEQLCVISDDKILQQIQEKFPDNNFCIAQIKEDDVVKSLWQFVEDNQIDIIAVSIQKRILLEKLFHWSISRQLALTSRIPLLALPAHPYHQQPVLYFENPNSRLVK